MVNISFHSRLCGIIFFLFDSVTFLTQHALKVWISSLTGHFLLKCLFFGVFLFYTRPSYHPTAWVGGIFCCAFNSASNMSISLSQSYTRNPSRTFTQHHPTSTLSLNNCNRSSKTASCLNIVAHLVEGIMCRCIMLSRHMWHRSQHSLAHAKGSSEHRACDYKIIHENMDWHAVDCYWWIGCFFRLFLYCIHKVSLVFGSIPLFLYQLIFCIFNDLSETEDSTLLFQYNIITCTCYPVHIICHMTVLGDCFIQCTSLRKALILTF